MDEESLLSETIENDLKNREKNKSEPDASKIRRSAVSKVKETSINAIKKFASKIYKAVCMGWIPALIIIFMLIGMISFITSENSSSDIFQYSSVNSLLYAGILPSPAVFSTTSIFSLNIFISNILVLT